jgi:hypothetical protein
MSEYTGLHVETKLTDNEMKILALDLGPHILQFPRGALGVRQTDEDVLLRGRVRAGRRLDLGQPSTRRQRKQ